MTDRAFITLLNMSYTAGYVILALIALRFLLPRAPRRLLYALWALPLFRLACPVSVESILSLLPSAQPIPLDLPYQAVPAIHSGIPALNAVVNPALAQSVPQAAASVNPLQIWLFAGKAFWMIGLTALLCYAIVTYTRLAHGLRFAAREGEVWRSDALATPLVLGFLRPRIYLPATVAGEACILAHERAHISRGDHILKPLAFLVLCVHWFNPLVWLAYGLMTKDMEGACDERVLRRASPAERSEYAACLLAMGARRSGLAVPLAFGESDLAGRIKRILHDKKPAFWLILGLALAAIILCVTLLSNPVGGVSLLDAAQSISAGMLNTNTMASTETGAGVRRIEQQDKAAAVEFIGNLRVRKEPVSQSRAENRDSANCLRLSFPSGGNGTYTVDFNFSADYAEVWIDNGVKPSFSFYVADPSAARAFFEGEESVAIIGSADGPTSILINKPDGPQGVLKPGETMLIDNNMMLKGENLGMFTTRVVVNENHPTYALGGEDVTRALAQLPVYPYMVLSRLSQIEVIIGNPDIDEIRLSHTLLDKEGKPLYHKPDGTPLDEECTFEAFVGESTIFGGRAVPLTSYVYTLQPSSLVTLSSLYPAYPEGALRCFSLRYHSGSNWYECCFALRTDEGMYGPGEVQAPESGAHIITPGEAARRYTELQRLFPETEPMYPWKDTTGDWDGDGKQDRAGFVEETVDFNNYRAALAVQFGDGKRIEAKAADFSDTSQWGTDYQVLGADVNGDGAKEMLLLINGGAAGGNGGYCLLVYEEQGGKWEPLASPGSGYYYQAHWDSATHTVEIVSPEVGYAERIVDDSMVLPRSDAYDRPQRIAWLDSLAEGIGASGSDSISAFALTEEGHIITRQYVTGPGGPHVERYGYMLAEYAYDAQNTLRIVSAWFVPTPAE